MEIKLLSARIRFSLWEPKAHNLIPKSVNNSKYRSFLDIYIYMPRSPKWSIPSNSTLLDL
jgi:hypothetical protein